MLGCVYISVKNPIFFQSKRVVALLFMTNCLAFSAPRFWRVARTLAKLCILAAMVQSLARCDEAKYQEKPVHMRTTAPQHHIYDAAFLIERTNAVIGAYAPHGSAFCVLFDDLVYG